MADKNEMPNEIWIGLMHESVTNTTSLRCESEKVGVDDISYTRTNHIQAQLDEVIGHIENHMSGGEGYLDTALTKLIEMREK